MSDIYIAKHSVGEFRLGEEIKGLNDERIKFLLAEGAIELQSKSKTKAVLNDEAEERAIIKDNDKTQKTKSTAKKD